VLMGRIHSTMDGLAGLAGFQWLFIVCGLITLPVRFPLVLPLRVQN
jgi:hypothetical protein